MPDGVAGEALSPDYAQKMRINPDNSDKSDSGLTLSGNPLLKPCIIQGALSLIKYDDTYKAFAQSMLARGKPKSVVIKAVANRWRRRLFHLVQH